MKEICTVDSWLEKWLDQQERECLTKITINSYRNIVWKHLIPEFHEIQIDTLTSNQIEEIYLGWEKQGISFNTIRTIHIALKRSLRSAYQEGLLQFDPDELCWQNHISAPQKLPTERQCYRYLNAAKQFKEYPMLYIALITDLPQAKIFALRWVHFNVRHKQIVIDKCVYKLDDKCFELLMRHRQNVGNCEWMFPNRKNQTYNRAQFYYLHTKVLDEAGLPQIAFSLIQKKLREVEL